MNSSFITSRPGQIDNLKVYRKYSESVLYKLVVIYVSVLFNISTDTLDLNKSVHSLPKRNTDKQCTSRSDPIKHGVRSGITLLV